MAIMDGLDNTGTLLLEPVQNFSISVPEEVGGKVLGDIINMRGTFDSPVISKGIFMVEGRLPVAESLDYAVRLGSISSGRGVLSTAFAGYEQCPPGKGEKAPRRGIDPRDTAKYILYIRNALSG
jgi:ribosomal protection tetracycline resistance protein